MCTILNSHGLSKNKKKNQNKKKSIQSLSKIPIFNKYKTNSLKEKNQELVLIV